MGTKTRNLGRVLSWVRRGSDEGARCHVPCGLRLSPLCESRQPKDEGRKLPGGAGSVLRERRNNDFMPSR